MKCKWFSAALMAAALIFTSLSSSASVIAEQFNNALARKGEKGAYDEIYQRAVRESAALQNAKSASQATADMFAELRLYMMNGAFALTASNDAAAALKYAEMYLDIPRIPALSSYTFDASPNDAQLAYFAASSNFNSKHYERAILHFGDYLATGDTKNAASVYNYCAKSFSYIGDEQKALLILDTGLTLYPTDLQMLTTGINMLAKSKNDDAKLSEYVEAALRQRPNDVALCTIAGQMYERMNDYEAAIKMFTQVLAMKPNHFDTTKHLALCYYNAGAQAYNNDGGKNKKNHTAKSVEYFKKAIPMLKDVMASDPLSLEYAYALGNAYSAIGDAPNLANINSKLTSLGREPIAAGNHPELASAFGAKANPATRPANNPIALPGANPVASNPIASNTPSSKPVTAPAVPQASPASAPVTQPAEPQRKLADVDMNIPKTNATNDKAFAFIIANNEYQKVANVDNADHDGKIFAEYCRSTLGIPSRQVITYNNVGYSDLIDVMDDIKKIAKVKKGDLDILFYYAGHGIPNEETKTGYLLPVDADGRQLRVCYPLAELYRELSDLNANNTVVMLDACFSGAASRSEGGNGMLFSARGVAIDVDDNAIDGKVVVLSAASGSETALSYDEMGHGMFTYFLLKKLQDTNGSVTLGQLADYINENVALESQLRNRKSQTPTVIAGEGYNGDGWKGIKLRK